jgi:hypothetical protein
VAGDATMGLGSLYIHFINQSVLAVVVNIILFG